MHTNNLFTAKRIKMIPALGAGLIAIFAAQTAFADALADIEAAHRKLQNQRMRTETTITDDKGKVTKRHTEYDTLERIHMSGDNKEYVLLPEGMWIKTGGNWEKPPIDMSGMVKKMLPFAEGMVHNAKNVRDEGMTTWQGQPAHAYSYDIDTSMFGMHLTSHSKEYINAAGLMIGSESDGQAMGHKTHTVQNISYDNSIRVAAPK